MTHTQYSKLALAIPSIEFLKNSYLEKIKSEISQHSGTITNNVSREMIAHLKEYLSAIQTSSQKPEHTAAEEVMFRKKVDEAAIKITSAISGHDSDKLSEEDINKFAMLAAELEQKARIASLQATQRIHRDLAKLVAVEALLGNVALNPEKFKFVQVAVGDKEQKQTRKRVVISPLTEPDPFDLSSKADLFSKKNGLLKYGDDFVKSIALAEALANVGKVKDETIKEISMGNGTVEEKLKMRREELKKQGYTLLIENCFDKQGQFVPEGREKLTAYVTRYPDLEKFMRDEFRKADLIKYKSINPIKERRLKNTMHAALFNASLTASDAKEKKSKLNIRYLANIFFSGHAKKQESKEDKEGEGRRERPRKE